MQYSNDYQPASLLLEEPQLKYVDLLNDLGFKHVFCRDANKDILMAFLNEIIPDRQIIDLEHIRNEQVPSDPETKASIFDLYCETSDGSKIVVELQRESQIDFVDRALYYGTFPIQNQIEKGKKRYTFNAVYIINILNFNLVELKQELDPVSRFRMKEIETNRTLSTKYTLIFIELRKFAKRLEEISPNNILEGFLFFLRHIHSLGKQPQEFQQQIWDRLFEAAQIAAMNNKDRQTYIKKMNSERDRINQWEYAMEQAKAEGLARGMAEGKDQGKAEEKILIAKNFKNSGIPYETIAQCTGLTIEEIEQL